MIRCAEPVTVAYRRGDEELPRVEGILGLVSLGAAPLGSVPAGCPALTLDMPALEAAGLTEVWSVAAPVTYGTLDGFAVAWTDEALFGAGTFLEGTMGSLEETTFAAYDRLFRGLDAAGYPALLRVWNSFPGITRSGGGLERYQGFSVGRHRAFAAHGRAVETAPAACAVGTGSGPLAIYFLAARRAGRPVENPRQVSAYHYPPRYGPRSPTFSRAVLVSSGERPQLFLSGTASIVGHESRHPEDPAAQAGEAMANIRAVVAEACNVGLPSDHRLVLKAYVRDPESLLAIRTRLGDWLRPEDEIVFVAAEICRQDLLVEIEGVCV